MYIDTIDKQDIFVVAAIGNESLPISYSAYHLLELYDNDEYIILKIVNNIDIIVGYLILKIYYDNIHIMSIAVLLKYRGKQYGTELLKYMKLHYPTNNYTLYVQTINKRAIMFYIKHGFTIKKYIPNYYTHLVNKDAYYCECINLNTMYMTNL
jgi:ribosomal protein S18 acetylase RimI-like enzyme